MVGEHERDHRLGHRDEARQEARIVTSLGDDGGRVAVLVDGSLLPGKTARRLHRGAQHDGHAVFARPPGTDGGGNRGGGFGGPKVGRKDHRGARRQDRPCGARVRRYSREDQWQVDDHHRRRDGDELNGG